MGGGGNGLDGLLRIGVADETMPGGCCLGLALTALIGPDALKEPDAFTLRPEIAGISWVFILSALAIATIIAEALEKRATGSLAMLRRMTAVSAGIICGLMRAGDVGTVWMCCIMISFGVSP